MLGINHLEGRGAIDKGREVEQECQQRALLPEADSGRRPHTGQDSSLVRHPLYNCPGYQRTEGISSALLRK